MNCPGELLRGRLGRLEEAIVDPAGRRASPFIIRSIVGLGFRDQLHHLHYEPNRRRCCGCQLAVSQARARAVAPSKGYEPDLASLDLYNRLGGNQRRILEAVGLEPNGARACADAEQLHPRAGRGARGMTQPLTIDVFLVLRHAICCGPD